MAVAPLNLTPTWQTWRMAGLRCLLLEENEADRFRRSLADLAAASIIAARPGEDSTVERRTGDASPQHRGSPPAGAFETLERAAGKPASALAPATTGQKDRVAEPAPAASSPTPRPENWPKAWQGLLAKVKPAPIAWTYAELGRDLLLTGSRERSLALREIISRLRLPKGSSTFWPAHLPRELAPELPAGKNEARSGPDLFRSGLDLLEARFLVVFGPDVLQGTAYEKLSLAPFSEQISEGRLILALPDFAGLLVERDRLDKVILFLDSILSRFLLP